MKLTKTAVHLLMLATALAAALVALAVMRRRSGGKEHFAVDEEEGGAEYQAKLHVIKVFDLALNRKPSADEITKYAAIGNEQDILLAVLADHNKEQGDLPPAAVAAEQQPKVEKMTQDQNVEETYVGAEAGKPAAAVTTQAAQICMRKDVLERTVRDMSDQLDRLKAMVFAH